MLTGVLLSLAGALIGIACGALFSYLLLSAGWLPRTAHVRLTLQAAIGLALGAVAAYRIRRHGLGFAECALLGSALSIVASAAVVVWVVTG